MTPKQLKEEKDRDKFFNSVEGVDQFTIDQMNLINGSSSTFTDDEFLVFENQEEPKSRLGSALEACKQMGIEF